MDNHAPNTSRIPPVFVLVTLAGALMLASVLAWAACGNGDKEAEPVQPTEEEVAQDESKQNGGRLVVQAIEPASLDPHTSSFPQDLSIERMLWRGLYSLDRDNRPVPAMAENDPQVSDEGRLFKVRLREGLRWSDGNDLKAEDFVLGIQRSCDPVIAGEYQYLLSNITGCDDFLNAPAGPDGEFGTADDLDPSVVDMSSFREAIGARAVDDRTIEFKLERPAPTFQIILSLWITYPVPAHILPDSHAPWPEGAGAPESLVFNGPYVLSTYVPGVSATLQPNPHWERQHSPVGETPSLDHLELRFLTDAGAVGPYESGEISFARAEVSQLATLAAKYGPTREYRKLIQPSTRGLEMNLAHPPLDNLQVRLGIGKAVAWQIMIDHCFSGRHQTTTTWIPEGVPAGQPADYQAELYAPNREEARRLIAEGGGINRELTLIVREGIESECQGKFIQQQLAENAGISVSLEVLNAPARSARFREGSFDLFPGGWIQAYPDPENWVLGQFDEPGTGLNHYNCNHPEIRRLLDEHEFNMDQEERAEAYERINELIVTEVCGVFPFYHEAAHYLKKPNVTGMYENSTLQDAIIAGDWAVEAWGLAPEPETGSASPSASPGG
jgi:oligopeptide transport system substrate-binding protein